MAIGAIASGAYGAAKTVGIDFGDVTSGIGDIFGISGRSKCTKQDKQKRKKIEQAIRQYLSPGEMRELVSGMSNRVPPTPEDMAYFYAGEDDCKHKNVGARHQRFLDELEQTLNRKARQAQQQSKSSGSGSGSGSSGGSTTVGGMFGLQQNTFLGILAAGVLIAIYAVRNG